MIIDEEVADMKAIIHYTMNGKVEGKHLNFFFSLGLDKVATCKKDYIIRIRANESCTNYLSCYIPRARDEEESASAKEKLLRRSLLPSYSSKTRENSKTCVKPLQTIT